MSPVFALLRSNPPARRFFAAYLQSSLGNGMGYVALVLVALERFHSPWAVALVLIADLLPLMLLGPMLGGAADHLPRRTCAIGADLLRAVAFLGIAMVDDIGATLALAALAGVGNGLFNPAVLSGMPRLVGERHLPAATSMFGAVSTLGRTVGPLLAAALLLGGGAEPALVVNGLSFLVSAALLTSLDLGRAERATTTPERATPGAEDGAPGWRLGPGFRRIVIGSSGAALFAGWANVADPPFIPGALAAPAAGFSVMVGLYFVGVAAGSLVGSRGGDPSRLWARYLTGIGAMG